MNEIELSVDQPNVTTAGEEEIRPAPNGDCASEIEKEKGKNKQPDIEQLIGFGARAKRPSGVVTRFRNARGSVAYRR